MTFRMADAADVPGARGAGAVGLPRRQQPGRVEPPRPTSSKASGRPGDGHGAVTGPGSVVLVALDGDGASRRLLPAARRDGLARTLGMFAVDPGRQGGGSRRGAARAGRAVRRDEWGAGELRMTVIVQRAELIAGTSGAATSAPAS
ncbi:hypothetical protein GCM10020218_049980 [Dactylosporangium vinaceum]